MFNREVSLNLILQFIEVCILHFAAENTLWHAHHALADRLYIHIVGHHEGVVTTHRRLASDCSESNRLL